LGGEFGYDTNYFQRASNENPAAAYRLRITPSLSLTTVGPQRRESLDGTDMPRIMFRGGVFAAYNELFAAESEHSDEISSQRHLAAGANALLQINRRRPLGVDLNAQFERFVDPTSEPAPAEGEIPEKQLDDRTLTRDVVRGGAGAIWRPGGGLFEWRFGYEAMYTYFEGADVRPDNNLQHEFGTRGRWRFLPRTAILFDGSYRMIRYTDSAPGSPRDGDIVAARVGLTGLLTPRIGLLGLVGWSSTFYDGAGQDADTVIGQAEIRYYVQPPPSFTHASAATGLSTIALGYTRDISNSYVSSYFRRDRGYLTLTYFLSGTFVAMLQGGVANLQYGRGVQYDAFNQQRVDARLFAEYRLSDSFGLNTTLMYSQNMSDNLRTFNGAVVNDNLDFTRFQAYIGARWFL